MNCNTKPFPFYSTVKCKYHSNQPCLQRNNKNTLKNIPADNQTDNRTYSNNKIKELSLNVVEDDCPLLLHFGLTKLQIKCIFLNCICRYTSVSFICNERMGGDLSLELTV